MMTVSKEQCSMSSLAAAVVTRLTGRKPKRVHGRSAKLILYQQFEQQEDCVKGGQNAPI